MKWYIGQPIVAIRNHSERKFKKGDEFIVKGITVSLCACKNVLIDVGIGSHIICNMECSHCGKLAEGGSNIQYYDEVCFAPLDVDISELTDILKEPIKEYVEK